MRRIAIVVGWVLGAVVLLFTLQLVAAESGEVVLLHTTDESGSEQETRLWIVEYGGASYLRAGSAGAAWYARLRARPEVEVVRGERLRVRAVPEPELRDAINDLMRAKYGWADAYISLVAGRDDAVPVRLDPSGSP